MADIRGYLLDLTESDRRGAAAATTLAVENAAVSRAVIEQAKGALMAFRRLTADEAFAALRVHSQHHNVKLKDLARALVESFSATTVHPDSEVQRVAALLLGPASGGR